MLNRPTASTANQPAPSSHPAVPIPPATAPSVMHARTQHSYKHPLRRGPWFLGLLGLAALTVAGVDTAWAGALPTSLPVKALKGNHPSETLGAAGVRAGVVGIGFLVVPKRHPSETFTASGRQPESSGPPGRSRARRPQSLVVSLTGQVLERQIDRLNSDGYPSFLTFDLHPGHSGSRDNSGLVLGARATRTKLPLKPSRPSGGPNSGPRERPNVRPRPERTPTMRVRLPSSRTETRLDGPG